ncbi:Cystathionine beta-lyase [Anatilimnocola aggregata]|uniref:Cystathionine beta-lyase n=1 Tax=Anatilimnocola aggregata TaxID=2528021 RepID=A0A517YLN2_9BACT|nr:aminotransferase class I/II-fold pyridoxal phosphate-dependent enzyme [Anatilimnocola aggregata]QDU31120.1 Cystathionine beta-lyase [Anatilimnocola aggregata]
MKPDDFLPRPERVQPLATHPHATPLYLTSVWECESPAQADAMLGGQEPGYVYQRDGHPNAAALAAKLNELEQAPHGVVVASGMAAISTALLATVGQGDHVVTASRVYGKTLQLLNAEASRLGITLSIVDTNDLAAVEAAMTDRTKLVLAETIANPLLQVADLGALAELAHRYNARLLVDNTFASPLVCRPMELGADFVMESLTKTLNGHSDVLLGYLGGRTDIWPRVKQVVSAWGFSSSPFDCWLAARGLATAHLRSERACHNALAAAEFLSQRREVGRVEYPGLPAHPQHALAKQQFTGQFGTMVAFELKGGRAAADKFIAAAKDIPFCPSLGELSTTLSHPETTSHRGLTPQGRADLGIAGGTIRLSVGTETPQHICSALASALLQV